MGWRKVSACVGCAECISCWRHSIYDFEFYCDKCDTENVELYDYEDEQVCRDCVVDALATKQKGECAECGDTEYLYRADDKRLCRYCLGDYLDANLIEIDYVDEE